MTWYQNPAFWIGGLLILRFAGELSLATRMVFIGVTLQSFAIIYQLWSMK